LKRNRFQRIATVGLMVAGVALAQGERVIAPLETFQIPDIRERVYVGSRGLRFVTPPNFYPGDYTILGEATSLYLSYAGPQRARALRLTPVAGGSSLRIPLDANNAPIEPQDFEFANSPAALNEPTFRASVVLNSADFGINPGRSASYRAVLIDESGREGEAVQVSLNFRAKADFVPNPRLARARETLREVIPVAAQQSFGQPSDGAGGAVYSIEVFETYSRVRTALRLGRNGDARYNQQFIPQAVNAGALTATDNTGQLYGFSVEGEEITINPQVNSLEIPLTMTPALRPTARTLILTFDPTKSPMPGSLLEPFRSGLSLPLTLKR
jgi:hypothetical protein